MDLKYCKDKFCKHLPILAYHTEDLQTRHSYPMPEMCKQRESVISQSQTLLCRNLEDVKHHLERSEMSWF